VRCTSEPASASFTKLGRFRRASAIEYCFDIEQVYINMYSPANPGTAQLAGLPTNAWFVSFLDGIAYNGLVEHPYRVRCVR